MNIFRRCLAVILHEEGGLSNHPKDPGGLTNRGITQAVYDGFRRSRGLSIQPVTKLTQEELLEIYWRGYWATTGCETLRPALALMQFNTAVNAGPAKANEIMAASRGDLDEYSARLGWHYARLDHLDDTFGLGWMRRLIQIHNTAKLWDSPPARKVFIPDHENPGKWKDVSGTRVEFDRTVVNDSIPGRTYIRTK